MCLRNRKQAGEAESSNVLGVGVRGMVVRERWEREVQNRATSLDPEVIRNGLSSANGQKPLDLEKKG